MYAVTGAAEGPPPGSKGWHLASELVAGGGQAEERGRGMARAEGQGQESARSEDKPFFENVKDGFSCCYHGRLAVKLTSPYFSKTRFCHH